jgi:hypothetical protein
VLLFVPIKFSVHWTPRAPAARAALAVGVFDPADFDRADFDE